MKNLKKIKQWALGVSVVTMLGFGWACTDEDAPDNLAPGFSSFSADDVMRTSAKLSASLTGSVNLVKEYGFQYSTSSEFPTDQTKTVKVGDGQPSGNFLADLNGLERNTTYYYRVYASTGATTVYSKYGVFNTPSSSKPDLADTRVVEIGENHAKISFQLVDIGDEHLIECGVGYMKSSNTDNAYTPVIAKWADSVYVAEIFDLEANTNYSFRPYAKNGAKADGSEGVIEGYGDVVQEKTDELMAPEVITEYETSSGISSMTVSGLIESAVGSNGVVFDCGFVWSSESQKPRLELNHQSVSMQAPEELDEHFVAEITGLMSNTTYYVCAYARNEVNGELKVGYGEAVSVSTGSLMTPNINIDSWGTTASSIFMTATITNYDKGALTEKGYIYDRSSEISLEEAKKNGTCVQTLIGANVFTDTIPSLSMNTSYMVRAYAVYEAEGAEPVIGYSGRYDITTNDYQAPNIGLELDHSKVTRNSAELVGKLYGEGNGTITEKGFVMIETSVTYEPTLKHKGVKKIVSDDSFVTVVKDLPKETSYAVRSYAISKLEAKVDTVYSGGWSSFQTLGIKAPAFNNVNLEDSKYNSFKATCGISDVGDGKLLEKGFWYKIGDNDFSEGKDSIIIETEAYDEFSKVISGVFEYDRDCYVCAYAKKEIDGAEVIFTSGWSNIWIPSPASTSFNEVKLDSVTYKSLKASASINEIGDGTILEKGFYWKKDNTDFSYELDSLVVESGDNDEFSAIITGLKYNNWYYGGAYTKVEVNGKIIINRSGWREIWIPEPSSTNFKDVTLEDATFKSFKATGGIKNIGDGTLLEKGFHYWMYDSNSNLVKDSIIIASDSLDTYSAIMDKNIKYDVWYYVCAYVKKDLDGTTLIQTSNSRDIWIPSPTGVTFGDVKLDSTNYHSFIATGSITGLGDATLLEKGFFWKMNSTDFSSGIDSLVVESDSYDSFSAKVEGLKSSESYYVGTYAKLDFNGKTVISRSSWNSTWTNNPIMPSFDYFSVKNDTYRKMDASVKINNENGDGEIIEKGFCLRQVGDNDWNHPTIEKNDSLIVIAEGDSIYTSIKNLEEGKEYYVRAFAKVKLANGEYIAYSETHGCTLSSANTPSISYWDWSVPDESRTRNSFTVKTSLESKGNGTITNRGFVLSEYAKNSEPTIGNCDFKYDDVDETFEKTITGLKHGTEYAVRAFVVAKWEEEVDTIYGDRIYNVSTRPVNLPTFKSISFSNHKLSEMTVTSEIKEMGDGTLKEKGFCWDRSTSDFTLETETTKKMAVTTDSLKLTLTDLDYNTRYYVRAYAKVEIDENEYIAYSDQSNDRTSSYNYPSLESAEINSDLTTRNSASMSCVLNNAGNGVIIEKGFVLSKCTVTYEPTLDNCAVQVVADNEFTATVTGLDWNTEYAVRGYVTSKWEETGQESTEYSGWRTCFWTKDVNYPTFNSIQVDSVSYSSIVVTSGVATVGDGELVEKGFIWTHCDDYYWQEPSLDHYVGMKAVESETNESYLLKVNNLKPNKRYGIRAYAKFTIDGKEGIGYSSISYFDTSSLNATINWTPEVTTCDFTAEFTDETSNIKNVYVYLTTESDENDLSKWTKYTLNQDETTLAFSKTIENLTQNTTYYLKVYYEYAGNLIEWTTSSFSTRRIPLSGDNVSPGKKEDE